MDNDITVLYTMFVFGNVFCTTLRREGWSVNKTQYNNTHNIQHWGMEQD